MSEGKDEGLLDEVAEELDEGGLIEPVVVRSHGHWHRVWKITRRGLYILLVLAVVGLIALWVERKPIANRTIADELHKRGVQGSYHLDRVGLRTQEISNVVIGDPANPDLTAQKAVVQLRFKLNGTFEVYRIVARGVRLKGRVIGRKVSWGQVDKLLPPPSGKPFTLPNIVVDVADTTVRLDTPYGRLGFALIGAGNLSGGFRGRLAASAPSLNPGKCAIDALKANVALAVDARRPHVIGPVSANRFACDVSRIALDRPRMEIDSKFSEAFGSFDGKGRLTFASFVAGSNGLANATSDLTFVGTPTEMRGKLKVAAQQARLAQIIAGQTRLDGDYRLDAAHGDLDLRADYGAGAVTLAPSMTAGLTKPLLAAKSTPVGPVATAIANAIAATTKRFAVDGHLVAINRPGAGGVRIETANVSAANGGRVSVSSGDGITYYWPSGRIRVDGHVETHGGGLPTAVIDLHQPRNGAPINGVASIAPYRAGSSSVELAPVRFAGQRDGSTRVTTNALLSGPFSGGRIEGLRLPIVATLGGAGGTRVGEGCVDARFARLRFGSLNLGPTRLPLCPTQGNAILTQRPGGALQAGAQTRNVRLSGTLGKSPFLGTAASAKINAGQGFDARTVKVRLGRPDAPVLIDAAGVTGVFAGSGARGRFTQANAVIGKVPLLLSDAAGTWGVRKGDLTVDSALTVSDRFSPARFYPLKSENVHFTLANDRIRATGLLKHPASGTPITNVTIDHRLSTGVGEALLDVPGIRFGSNLQPEELTRLTEGVIALVTGRVEGQGRIAWSGDGKVASTGQFNVIDTDLAAPFGPVTGINTTVNSTDLLGLTTAPGQVMTAKTINPGILVENGVIRYQLLPDQLVKVERGEWPFMGGKLILQETVLNFGRPSPKRLTFEVVGLDAHTFVSSMGFTEIDATGVFDGVLPMIFDDEGGRIVGGRLDSRPGGGTLSYNGVVNRANLGLFGGIAFDALRNLSFKSMIIRLDGYLDGEFATRLTIDQVGLGNATKTQRFIKSINKVPFKFNVTIKGPFRALIATAKSFRDPRPLIADTLPTPLDKIPGVVTEVRRIEEQQAQTQTPVNDQVTVEKPTTSPR